MATDLFQLHDRETGDVFVFTPLAPQRPLDIGGRASIAVHEAPGRAPSQQFIGPGVTEVSFGGVLYGESAWDDHLTLDRMRRQGHEHDVIWGPFKKRVRIADLSFNVELRSLIRYRMRLIEIHDASKPETQEWKTWQKPVWQAEQILAELSLFELLTRDLRGFLFEFWELLNTVLSLVGSFAHDLAELGRFGAELASQPQRLITALRLRAESVRSDLSNSWQALDAAFGSEENESELASADEDLVNSRLAGEQIHANLRQWLIRLLLVEYGLTALAAPRRIVRYIVSDGDTLRQIARGELGDAGRWHEIAEANSLTDLNLETGTVLTIPVGE